MAFPASGHVWYPRTPEGFLFVQELSPTPHPPKLLDRVREANRLRHVSRSTEKSYVGCIRRYILFHGKRHPAKMGAPRGHPFPQLPGRREHGRRLHPGPGVEPPRESTPTSSTGPPASRVPPPASSAVINRTAGLGASAIIQ